MIRKVMKKDTREILLEGDEKKRKYKVGDVRGWDAKAREAKGY